MQLTSRAILFSDEQPGETDEPGSRQVIISPQELKKKGDEIIFTFSAPINGAGPPRQIAFAIDARSVHGRKLLLLRQDGNALEPIMPIDLSGQNFCLRFQSTPIPAIENGTPINPPSHLLVSVQGTNFMKIKEFQILPPRTSPTTDVQYLMAVRTSKTALITNARISDTSRFSRQLPVNLQPFARQIIKTLPQAVPTFR